MKLTKNSICDFGWKARDFALKGVDGKTYTLADVRGPKGTLVVFICNHCPYVKASIGRIVAEARALREIGIGTIAVMPNDAATYREDSFDNMKAFAFLTPISLRAPPTSVPSIAHSRRRQGPSSVPSRREGSRSPWGNPSRDSTGRPSKAQ
jgi:hypothetical protein